jgi:mutator protein MutT
VIDVAVALIERNGSYLITRRPRGTHLEGYWEFPGGKRHPDETFEVCLAREILEEVGVEVSVGEKVVEVEHVYPEHSVRLHVYLCRLTRGEPRPLAVEEVQWARPAEMDRCLFPQADAPILAWIRAQGQ